MNLSGDWAEVVNHINSAKEQTMSHSLMRLVEKVFWTYVQALIVGLPATFFDSLDLSVAKVAAIAAIPAVLTLLANATTAATIPESLPFRVQALLRVLRTFGVGFLGYLLAIPMFSLDPVLWKAGLAAGAMSALAAIKAEAARAIGNSESPATLTIKADPLQVPSAFV